MKLNSIKIEVTHQCMLKCVHCSSRAGTSVKREMSLETCNDIIQQAHVLGAKNVAISGGEPLLWENLEKTIEFAHQLGLHTTVYSSGASDSFSEKFKLLTEKGLDRVIFSVFGPDPETHEQMTNVLGSFNRTINSAKLCKENGLEVELHFVPIKTNFEHLPAISRFASEMGIKKVSVLRFVPQGRGAENCKIDLSNSEYRMLRETILDLKKQGFEIRTGSPFNVLWLNENPKCMSGLDRLIVNPELQVFPCDAFKGITCFDLGVSEDCNKLNGQTLRSVWLESQYFRKVRELVKSPPEHCNTCKMFKKCGSGCVAQKIHKGFSPAKSFDPICLLNEDSKIQYKRMRKY